MTLFLILMAAHAGWYIDEDSTHAIGVSGTRGEVHSQKGLLRGVAIQRADNLACAVGILPTLATYSDTRWWAHDVPLAGCAQAVSFGATVEELVELPDSEQSVYAVQVCTRDTGDTARDSVTGVRIWGAKSEMGLARHIDTRFQAKMGDCDKWRKKLECPAGEVVTAIRAHHNGTTYTGIGVSCAKAQQSSSGQQIPRQR